MLPLWTKFCGVWLLASAAVRGARARWLWFRTARGLQPEPPCACAAAVVSGWCWWCPLRSCSRWNMAWCRAHLPTRCNCGALGAACAEPILILRYMNLYYLITVVNKIIVFLKNNCISYLDRFHIKLLFSD